MAMVGDAGDQGREPLQLWQFLLVLLKNTANKSFITWTGHGHGRFKLIKPEEVSSINLNLT